MIVLLLTSFFAVLFIELMNGTMMVEGMKTKDGDAEHEESEDAEAEEQDETTPNPKPTKPAPTVEGNDGQKTANKPAAAAASKVTEHNPKEVPKEAKKQGLSTLTPASYNGKGGDDSKSGNRIDYASTLEQAYDNIENMIGEDGVRGLTDQTKSLMNQQKELMNNMKDIEPLLKSAQGFMEQMTGNGGLSGISKMLQGFGGGSSEQKAK